MHTLGFEQTSMASLDRWNIGGNLEYNLCCNMSGAPGKDNPPPTTRTLPYSFFFTSNDAKIKNMVVKTTLEFFKEPRHAKMSLVGRVLNWRLKMFYIFFQQVLSIISF